MPNPRLSLDEIKSRLDSYVKDTVPGQKFALRPSYDGILGSRFMASHASVEVYLLNGDEDKKGIKVAEVGMLLRAETSLQKVGELYAEQTTVLGPNKKHRPVYGPDADRAPADRVFAESRLVKAVRG